ncbi:hypothetical protein [Anaerofustis stercorihominis]|uniref:hypothetical protein n=1 Tax=Anaerofustis stercorihominis TaxID=214853 RepID=UPI0039841C4D
MGNICSKKKIIDFFNHFSSKEKERRRFEEYKEKINRYDCMSKDEFSLKYNDVRTDYEHEKMILLTIIATVLVSILMNIWGRCFDFFKNAIIIISQSNNQEEIMIRASFIITAIVLLLVTSVLFLIIYNKFKQVKKLLWEVNLLQEYKQEKLNNEEK